MHERGSPSSAEAEKIYSFTDRKDEKTENQMQVFSVLKIIEQIHEDYPSLTISNEGESDFIIEYVPDPKKPKVINAVKTVLLCIIIFLVRHLRSWHLIMIFL